MRLTILLLFVYKFVEIQSLGSETKTGRGFQTKIIPGRVTPTEAPDPCSWPDITPTEAPDPCPRPDITTTKAPPTPRPPMPGNPCSPTVIHSAVCDDKKSYCKANAFKCMDPNYYFNCRKSCGCRGNCHDVSANCIMWPAGCLESESCEKCPRFCGFCEGQFIFYK
uniref:ShKT domain-containing protein n=1 Tax=Lepeophtheirus salmonis TaxID=72036 RepID=A0A0K2SYB7_LEPSM